MKTSRIVAVVIAAGAAIWIGSGVIGRKEHGVSAAPAQKAARPLFQVAVQPVHVVDHARQIVLSGQTEADRKATAIARAAGVIVKLAVRRGSLVKTGDVVAVLSDEAREAMVEQARARVQQRTQELEARLKLIASGNYPAINKPQLEAELKTAQATLAQAEAERKKGEVLAPISGVVNDVPVEVGQALQSGATVAKVIALDPMLAVVEVAERQLSGVKVGELAQVKLVTGRTAQGRVRFISPVASPQTRTYRVEVELANHDGSIPDGVTCDASLKLSPVPAAAIPGSALTFSASGKLGVRIVDADGKVAFVPVSVVEETPQSMWVSGLADGARLIVQGQDFVKEGDTVQPVPARAQS